MAPSPSVGAYGGAGPFEMGLTWALAALGTVVILARACVSLRTSDRLEWDLFWALLTYVRCSKRLDPRQVCTLTVISAAIQLTTLAAQAMQTAAAAYGIGNHQWLLNPEDIKLGSMWNCVGRIVGIFAATLGKNTIIALLLRIQGTTHRRKAWFLHFVWITNALLCIIIVVVLCLRCRPIELWWDKSLTGTRDAIDSTVTKSLGLFQGSWMAASDVALALYPTFIFWNLQMSWKRKAGLSVLMGGGLIAGVCGILKTIQVLRAYESVDVSYNIYPLLITTLVECWMILILASVPPLRYLFVKAFRQTRVALTRSLVTDGEHSQMPNSHGTVKLMQLPQSMEDRKGRRNRKEDFDNESEEEILPQRAPKRNGNAAWTRTSVHLAVDPGITITRDFKVSHEANGHAKA